MKPILKVDKNENGQTMMKVLALRLDIRGALDLKKAGLLVKKTLETGFILKSVKTTIIPEVYINDQRITL